MAEDLSVQNRIIGATSYDLTMKGKAAVVGTLINPSIEAIVQLHPDAVFLCDEDSAVQHTETLSAAGIQTEQFKRIQTFEDSLSVFIKMGSLLGKKTEAEQKAEWYRKAYGQKRSAAEKKILFLVSADPLIAASDSSFAGAAIRNAGGICAAGNADNPYPMLTKEFVVLASPDIIIFASGEPVDQIKKAFIRFPNLPFMRNNAITAMDPDKACLYDPADILETKNRIADTADGR